jgi:hypothetical protein
VDIGQPEFFGTRCDGVRMRDAAGCHRAWTILIYIQLSVHVRIMSGTKVGHGYTRGYRQLNPYPYPPKPYPVRVGCKTRAGKPAVSQPPADRPTRRV